MLDIYVVNRSNGKTVIENLAQPVNSTGDDFGLFLFKPDRGFFTSNREGGKGDDDIYTFINDDPNLKVVTDAQDDNIPPRTGDLYFIDNAVQPGVGTVKARGVTPNSDRALWPSQFVRVRLILDVLKEARLVPGSAVQIGQNGPYLFVVRPDSTLELRPMKPYGKNGRQK